MLPRMLPRPLPHQGISRRSGCCHERGRLGRAAPVARSVRGPPASDGKVPQAEAVAPVVGEEDVVGIALAASDRKSSSVGTAGGRTSSQPGSSRVMRGWYLPNAVGTERRRSAATPTPRGRRSRSDRPRSSRTSKGRCGRRRPSSRRGPRYTKGSTRTMSAWPRRAPSRRFPCGGTPRARRAALRSGHAGSPSRPRLG